MDVEELPDQANPPKGVRASVTAVESNSKRRGGSITGFTRRHSPTSSNLKVRGLNHSEREELDLYMQFFTNLYEETQMTDIREIVSSFQAAEVDKDKLHRDIVSTNRQIELLQEEISVEMKKMSALKQLSPEEMQRYNEVKQLEGEKRRNQELLSSYEVKIHALNKNIEAFRVNDSKDRTAFRRYWTCWIST